MWYLEHDCLKTSTFTFQTLCCSRIAVKPQSRAGKGRSVEFGRFSLQKLVFNSVSGKMLTRCENNILYLSSLQLSGPLRFHLQFRTGLVFKTFAPKSLRAPTHEQEARAVTFTRMRDDIKSVIESNAVLPGVLQPSVANADLQLSNGWWYLSPWRPIGPSVSVIHPLPIHQALRTELLTAWRNYWLRWCLINHQVLISGSAFIALCLQGDWLKVDSSHCVTGRDVDCDIYCTRIVMRLAQKHDHIS